MLTEFAPLHPGLLASYSPGNLYFSMVLFLGRVTGEPYFERTLQVLGWTDNAKYEEIARGIILESSAYRKKHLIFEARKWEAFAKALRRQSESHSSQLSGVIDIANTRTGRNKPCPCGSGKKYKRCCGT
jgi:hypothetical protein